MPRTTPPERLSEIIAATIKVLLHKGYRRTQMSDISQELGLSAGALYRYVEGKEALFDLVIRDVAGQRPEAPELPLPNPAPGAILAFVTETIAREDGIPSLLHALESKAPEDLRAELESIASELFRATARNQVGLKIIERSAYEWPELAEIWWNTARQAVVELLAAYIEKRGDRLHSFPNVEAASRVFTEVTAYYAMHRHYDPKPTEMTEEEAEATAVAVIVRAFLKE